VHPRMCCIGRAVPRRSALVGGGRNGSPPKLVSGSGRSRVNCVVRSVTDELNKVTPAARQRSGARHKEPQLPMQIHRSRHTRGFTVLPNAVLQDRRLSYTARGLLADLLSRPDGWREDGRHMADTSPQGRHAVAKALRELARFGYYRVERVRRADGTFTSQAHVYDVPQVTPSAVHPGSGRPAADDPGVHPVKDRGKEPSLPRQRTAADTASCAGADGRRKSLVSAPAPSGPPDAAMGEAAAVLHRVTAAEPRLHLGTAEAAALAPLVAPWLERGLGTRELTHALVSGLPERVHSASAFLRDRLTRKLPPAVAPAATAPKPRWHECTSCGRPTPNAGTCHICANPSSPPSRETSERADTAARGRALVRAALGGHGPQPGSLAAARA
jgi:hypothetical protein